MSRFSFEPAQLEAALNAAITTPVHRHQKRATWPRYEEEAFKEMRRLPGRHVIVVLMDPTNPNNSIAKAEFRSDQTLERLSAYDTSQVYRLVPPIPISSSIPMGDASTEHEDIGSGHHGGMQLQQMRDNSAVQDKQWELKNPDLSSTGGRNEETLKALFADVLDDAVGTYEAKIQTEPSCELGHMYSVDVSSSLPGVRIFGPNFVQLIP